MYTYAVVYTIYIPNVLICAFKGVNIQSALCKKKSESTNPPTNQILNEPYLTILRTLFEGSDHKHMHHK